MANRRAADRTEPLAAHRRSAQANGVRFELSSAQVEQILPSLKPLVTRWPSASSQLNNCPAIGLFTLLVSAHVERLSIRADAQFLSELLRGGQLYHRG
jgi:hypothetical protein